MFLYIRQNKIKKEFDIICKILVWMIIIYSYNILGNTKLLGACLRKGGGVNDKERFFNLIFNHYHLLTYPITYEMVMIIKRKSTQA